MSKTLRRLKTKKYNSGRRKNQIKPDSNFPLAQGGRSPLYVDEYDPDNPDHERDITERID